MLGLTFTSKKIPKTRQNTPTKACKILFAYSKRQMHVLHVKPKTNESKLSNYKSQCIRNPKRASIRFYDYDAT